MGQQTSTGIFIRTVPNVMRHYGCSPEDAQHFIDLRAEGYSTYQAALLAGLADPTDDTEDDAESA